MLESLSAQSTRSKKKKELLTMKNHKPLKRQSGEKKRGRISMTFVKGDVY